MSASIPLWVAESAAEFWSAVGEAGPFPRDLRRPIRRALPMAVVELTGLSVGRVADWLQAAGVGCPFPAADRPLRACLVARNGVGIAFIDDADAEDEQRFSLAHELAHFLRHYWGPRRRACRRLGADAAEAFDGARPPNLAERLHALLAGVALGFQTHLMERGPRRQEVAAAEEEADRLAYELLAPAGEVLARVGGGRIENPSHGEVAQLLRVVFGLPAGQACDYAGLLLPPRVSDPLLARLGASAQR